jgi:hypothetical protein
MGRYHKNLKEPGIPPWVCCLCGTPEYRNCKHRHTPEYEAIRESDYRSVRKMVDFSASHPTLPGIRNINNPI